MAIVKTVNIEVNTKKGQKEIKDLNKSIEGINFEVKETNKSNTDLVDGFSKGGKKASKGLSFITKGFKGLGLAIKAAGIGLVISALASLKEIFSQNQKVADAFTTVFETFSIVANEVVTAIINVYESVSKSSENFDALGKVLGSIIKLQMTPFKLAFFGIKLAIQTAQLGWEESFFGDKDPETIKELRAKIKQTAQDIKEVGSDAIDAGKNIVTNIGEAVNEVANIGKVAGDEFGKISVKNATIQAKANVELKKQAELAAVINQGLIEKFDRQAEQLRQVRDDESKNIEVRIKANEKLAEVLDQQEEEMRANAKLMVARAEAELSKNEENIELQKAYQEALNEQAAIEAQITGFRSEQQTNVNSLLKEQKDIQNELALIGKSERDIQREELKQQLEQNKQLINRQVTDEEQKNELLLIAQNDYRTKLKHLNDQFNAEDLETQKQFDEQLAESETNLQQAKINAVRGGLQILGQLASKNKALSAGLLVVEKGLAIAEVITNASKAIAAAKANLAATPAVIGTIPNPLYIKQAVATAKGILSTKLSAATSIATIAAQAIPGLAGGGGGGGSAGGLGGGGGDSQAPSFNVVGATETSQLADAVAGQTQQPVQAFVVANDVTTAQSLENNIVEGATL